MKKYIVCVAFDFGSVVYKTYTAKNVTDLVRQASEEKATVLFIESEQA